MPTQYTFWCSGCLEREQARDEREFLAERELERERREEKRNFVEGENCPPEDTF